MQHLILCAFLLTSLYSYAQPQANKPQLVGGRCEGCEAVFEYTNEPTSNSIELPKYGEEPKLKISGTIYKPDGKTPAGNVILYVYHTDETGIYPTEGDEIGWAKRHGYIRGWLKTDAQGNYEINTFRPAVYPSRNAPAHIHATILEPNGKYYYIADFFFDDDELLSATMRNSKHRGGSGILQLKKDGETLTGQRDIILGENIPGY